MRFIAIIIAATAAMAGCSRSAFDDREVSRCAPGCVVDPFTPGILESDGSITASGVVVTGDATVIAVGSVVGPSLSASAVVHVDTVSLPETPTALGVVFAAFDGQSTTWQSLYDADGATTEVRAAIADGNHVISCGELTGTLQMQGQDVVANPTRQQPLIAEHDSSGSLLWTHLVPSSIGNAQCHGIAASTSLLAIAGIFSGTINPGGGDLIAQTDSNAYVAVYDKATFSLRYAHGLVETGVSHARSSAITSDDEVYFGGYFADAVDFGAGAVTSVGGFDSYIVRYDIEGAPTATALLAGDGDDVMLRIALQPDSTAVSFCAHTTSHTLSAAGIALTSSGIDAPLIGGVDASGSATWARVINSGSAGQCNDLVVDASGTTYVGGVIEDSADFGAGVETHAGQHAFVAAYDAAGDLQWARVWDDGTSVTSITADASGRLWLFGTFESTITLDGTTYTATHPAAAFVARARPD